mmetsp:Transcript_19527/g.45796  ORF Transcript_19527/g.45796 Transcript_19527/m.45796 type:complete len:208 (+) Transcript_19527:1-624(+)
MSAVTLQVQLCEYRQFRHSLARNKYGLADDESMRGLVENVRVKRVIHFDRASKCVHFNFPAKDGVRIRFEVSVREAGKSQRVARRVATLCFKKLCAGMSHAQVLQLRDSLLKHYDASKDVPHCSGAWKATRTWYAKKCVTFRWRSKSGREGPFTVRMSSAGGLLQAERIARLCWARFLSGAEKAAVLRYRDFLYKRERRKHCGQGTW